MTDPVWLRPSTAAKQFGIARQTLGTWADRGWIGRSRIGRVTLLSGSDIADVIAARAEPRTLVPTGRVQPAGPSSWRNDELWRGVAQ